MTATGTSAKAEWRNHFMLPIAAALGYSTSVIHIYGLGPYIEPISQQFGWTRAQLTFGLTISTVISGIFCIPIGMLVDRVGPRPLGLIGCVLMMGAFALLGTTTGELWNWYLLWGVLACGTLFVQATIWTGAVASRFSSSRGFALAVCLSGASVGAMVFPVLATWLIGRYGWEQAMAIEAAIWLAVCFPVLAFFFRGAQDKQRKPVAVSESAEPVVLTGLTMGEGLRSTIYWRIFLASTLFTFTIIALSVHFVPILTNLGAEPLAAAGVAALVGIFSIIGRLATGLLLDRFRGSLVGAAMFLLPVLGCLLLLGSGGDAIAQSVAAALIGLTLGSEVDVIVYLVTRHFGLRNFGALYGGMLMALSLGTAIGPVAAAAVYDADGTYASFLWLTIALMVVSSLSLVTLPRPAYNR